MNGELKDILKENPFKAELVENWRKEAHDFSSKSWPSNQSCLPRFVLSDDEAWIRANSEKYRCYEHAHHIHSELLPNPFIGHPSAPIWILMINPSWCHVDIFDLINATPEARVYSASPLCDDPKQRVANIKAESANQIARRIDKQADQLLLKDDADFFVFDRSFNTCVTAGNVSYGAYGWWQKCLVGSGGSNFPLRSLAADEDTMAQEFARKVFVLECSPYRSRHFESKVLSRALQESSYGRFWQKMVRYAFGHGKKIVLRTSRRAKRTLLIETLQWMGLDTVGPNMARLQNCQRITISEGNLEPRRFADDIERIAQDLR